MKYLLLSSVFLTNLVISAPQPKSLEGDLQALKLEEHQAPSAISTERLYAAQSRYVPLKHRLELSAGVGKNFTPGSFLSSQGFDGSLHFYFTDRFYVSGSGSYVGNSWSESAIRLKEEQDIYPDIAPVKLRTDLLLGYHLFYGKFRLSMDSVFYFDQYWALGGGYLKTDNGLVESWSPAVVADVGFAFWFGRNWSVRLGLKDYFFNEKRRLSESTVHHFVGHASVGFVFGGGV